MRGREPVKLGSTSATDIPAGKGKGRAAHTEGPLHKDLGRSRGAGGRAGWPLCSAAAAPGADRGAGSPRDQVTGWGGISHTDALWGRAEQAARLPCRKEALHAGGETRQPPAFKVTPHRNPSLLMLSHSNRHFSLRATQLLPEGSEHRAGGSQHPEAGGDEHWAPQVLLGQLSTSGSAQAGGTHARGGTVRGRAGPHWHHPQLLQPHLTPQPPSPASPRPVAVGRRAAPAGSPCSRAGVLTCWPTGPS